MNVMSLDNPSSILVVRPDAIGDVTLMIPFLNSIKKTYPNAKVTVLLQPYTKALLENHPSVDSVLLDLRKTESITGLGGFFRYVSVIRSHHFDMVFFSYLDGYFASIMACAGIPIRIGDGNKVLIRLLLTNPVNQEFRNILCHETEQNNSLLVRYKKEASLSKDMNIICSDDTRDCASEILKDNGWAGERLIGIHPSTGGGNRAWLPQRYGELINLIHSNTDYRVVLTGFGPTDRTLIDAILTYVTGFPIVLFEKTTLEELKGIITHYQVIVGTDTGPTHIAAALQIPVLCVSPTKFVKSLRWGPWNVSSRIVGKPYVCDLVCNPYKCKLPTCLESISAEDVFEQLNYLIEERVEEINLQSRWVISSLNIGFYYTNDDELTALLPAIKQAHYEGARTFLMSPKQTSDTKECLFFFHVPNIIKLLKTVAKHDVNVIVLAKKPSLFWTVFRQLTGPFMYVPSFIFKVNNRACYDFVEYIKEQIRMIYSPHDSTQD